MTPAERRVLLIFLLWLAAGVAVDLSLLRAPRRLALWIGPEAVEELAHSLPAGSVGPGGEPGHSAPGAALPPRAPSPYDAAGRLRVNLADSSALVALEGVGPVLAGRLLGRRREIGRFRGPDDLRRVKGIGPATLARLLPQISFAGPDTAAASVP
jgi:hypothetical protein